MLHVNFRFVKQFFLTNMFQHFLRSPSRGLFYKNRYEMLHTLELLYLHLADLSFKGLVLGTGLFCKYWSSVVETWQFL